MASYFKKLCILALASFLLFPRVHANTCFEGDGYKWPILVGTETRSGEMELLSIDNKDDRYMVVGGRGTETTFDMGGSSSYGFIGRLDT